MTAVKICGIKSAAAFDAVVEAGADYVGLNLFSPSPRYVTPEQAATLAARHAGGPLRVGLFVQPTIDEIAAALAAVRLDILQVYASAAHCRGIRAAFEIPVWRSIGVTAATELPADTESLDGFIIEARPPDGATRPGGNAVTLNWRLLAGWQAASPWLLAGGLTAANVAEAVGLSGAPGVDVSSGVETAPGEKSPELIHRFVSTVRRLQAQT